MSIEQRDGEWAVSTSKELYDLDKLNDDWMGANVVLWDSLISTPLQVFRGHSCVRKMRFTQLNPDGFPCPSHEDKRAIETIINRHLAGDRDLLMCQDELIEAGFEKWARI